MNTKPGSGIGYTKEYDELGKLIYHDAGEVFYGYEYDSNDRLIKETSRTLSGYGIQDMETEQRYEYHDEGYRITKIRTKIIDDSSTTDVLKNNFTLTEEEYNASYPRDVNEIESVYEAILKNNNIIASQTNDLKNHRFYFSDFKYSDNLLVEEKKYELINGQKTLIFSIKLEYNENKKLVREIKLDLLENIEKKLDIQYNNNKVIETFSTNGYVDEKVVKLYDFVDNLIKDGDTQYLYIYDSNEDSFGEWLVMKIEGVVINNYFDLYSTTKYEYFNKSTILGIKKKLGYKTLHLNTAQDKDGEPTVWMRHWDSDRRIAVSIHKDLVAEIKRNPNLDGLYTLQAIRDGQEGKYKAITILK